MLVTSVSLNIVRRCWERLPMIDRTKHPSLTDLHEKHFDRLLDYLNTSSDVLVGYKACPLLESMLTSHDIVESSPVPVNSGEISVNPGYTENRYAHISRYIQLLEMRTPEREALSSIEETNRYNSDDALIFAHMLKNRMSRSMTKQTRIETGTGVLSQSKDLQACEEEKSQPATTANSAVHTPRARRLRLRHSTDWFCNSEGISSALQNFVNHTEINIDDLENLLYLRRVLNHSYRTVPRHPHLTVL